MGVQRDSSADDAAALTMRRRIEGETSAPPVTLTGASAADIRIKLTRLYELLERIERRTKIRFERDQLREARLQVGNMLALLAQATHNSAMAQQRVP